MTNTATWTSLGPAEQFAADEHTCTTHAGKPLIVFRIGEDFHVTSNLCPHAGLPLGEGERRGYVITCPYHGYAYNIRNGRNVDFPHEELPLKTYPTRVREGQLEIQMELPMPQSSTPQAADARPDHDQPRGPAPSQNPAGEPDCDPVPGQTTKPGAPECPTGYPGEDPSKPQTPGKTDPYPKPEPTKEGN